MKDYSDRALPGMIFASLLLLLIGVYFILQVRIVSSERFEDGSGRIVLTYCLPDEDCGK